MGVGKSRSVCVKNSFFITPSRFTQFPQVVIFLNITTIVQKYSTLYSDVMQIAFEPLSEILQTFMTSLSMDVDIM